jgi:DNA-binding response OmpR family regulator
MFLTYFHINKNMNQTLTSRITTIAAPVKTVLVIDDEEFISALIAKALVKEGYDVLVSSDLESSSKIMKEKNIDLIISDVLLSSDNYGDISFHINKLKQIVKVPLILVTGLDSDALKNSEITDQTILTKPFDMGNLISLVRNKLKAAQ